MRLIHEFFGMDPVTLGEEHIRDYLLYVKRQKGWKPRTIRQTVACARAFYHDMLGRPLWKLFDDVRMRDDEQLPMR